MTNLLKPITIIIFFWGLVLIFLSNYYQAYSRYFLYASILIIVPIVIADMIKQRKQDKVNNTNIVQSKIYSMLIVTAVLFIMFFLTKQNHI